MSTLNTILLSVITLIGMIGVIHLATTPNGCYAGLFSADPSTVCAAG